MTAVRIGLIVAALLAVVAVLATWRGARRQERELSECVDRLVRGAAQSAPATTELDSLPKPVKRYLSWALPEDRIITTVRMQQTGTLRTDGRTERWLTFTAAHVIAPAAVGFVWNARVSIAPMLHVRVSDALIDGEGSGQVSLLSAFPISAAAGGPEMNSGSLHRFLAEAVWYPTALRPSASLAWTAIDANRALATLTSHGVSVSLEFRFGESGEVTGIFTPTRWGTFAGGYQQRPWEGHFRKYERRGGIMIPTDADVGWYFENDWRAVWKGIITTFEPHTIAVTAPVR